MEKIYTYSYILHNKIHCWHFYFAYFSLFWNFSLFRFNFFTILSCFTLFWCSMVSLLLGCFTITIIAITGITDIIIFCEDACQQEEEGGWENKWRKRGFQTFLSLQLIFKYFFRLVLHLLTTHLQVWPRHILAYHKYFVTFPNSTY